MSASSKQRPARLTHGHPPEVDLRWNYPIKPKKTLSIREVQEVREVREVRDDRPACSLIQLSQDKVWTGVNPLRIHGSLSRPTDRESQVRLRRSRPCPYRSTKPSSPPEADRPGAEAPQAALAAMSPRIVQPMIFTKREICPIGRSIPLTAQFSANFRDFPNTAPPTAEFRLFQAAGAPHTHPITALYI